MLVSLEMLVSSNYTKLGKPLVYSNNMSCVMQMLWSLILPLHRGIIENTFDSKVALSYVGQTC